MDGLEIKVLWDQVWNKKSHPSSRGKYSKLCMGGHMSTFDLLLCMSGVERIFLNLKLCSHFLSKCKCILDFV
jgi:hypothetical protein